MSATITTSSTSYDLTTADSVRQGVITIGSNRGPLHVWVYIFASANLAEAEIRFDSGRGELVAHVKSADASALAGMLRAEAAGLPRGSDNRKRLNACARLVESDVRAWRDAVRDFWIARRAA